MLTNETGFHTRQLKVDDSLSPKQYKMIAELIFETDKYIYPVLFSGDDKPRENAEKVLPYVIEYEKDSMFCKDNIYICEDKSGIQGLILWKKGQLQWDYCSFIRAASHVGVVLNESAVMSVAENYITKQYLTESEDSSEQISLINVCVAKSARGCGVGKQMISDFIANHILEPMELCVLCDNLIAIKLYEEKGFQISSQFAGFSITAPKPMCYSMYRLPEDKKQRL